MRDASRQRGTDVRRDDRPVRRRQIIELLLVIGQYMMLARVMATAQIDMDPPIGARARAGA